ncbi:MAG: hypothetical protein U1E15_02565 [Hyphomicrobiales bacterium]
MYRATLATALLAGSLFSTAAIADGLKLTPVTADNSKADGVAVANAISPELTQAIVAEGKMTLENPTDLIGYYGYDNDGPLMAAAGDVQSKDHNVEATKTEPDKNTYLVLEGQKGPDAAYNYGKHFLFQGHENGVTKDGKPQGYFTRINLDADEAHRVTLMATKDTSGNALVFFDGSTWAPEAKRLLLTGEEGDEGGVWQATADFPSTVDDLRGVMGIGSYEGVQADKDGNIWLVEDAGGKGGDKTKHAKQPNSFVYRFVPADKTDLTKGGKLEVLQIAGKDGAPVLFNKGKNDDDILSQGVADQYTYGNQLKTKWVVVHDTASDGTAIFNANDLAKAKGGTPLKRPENSQFRPGTDFTEYYFTATGDTNAETEAGAEHGGFGGIFKLKQASASADEGTLSLVYRGDVGHSGFDNMAFLTADQIIAVEDGGDKLHGQRKAFDAGYVIDLNTDYGAAGAAEPVRMISNGRDELATADSALLAKADDNGFQNDGDNEITGIHVSDGDASVAGLLGTKIPTPFKDGWRVFYTRQHGKNETYEVMSK